MTMLIENPRLEEELKEQRKAWGADQHDEVWEGVYFMPPMANDDHQDLVLEFAAVLREAIPTWPRQSPPWRQSCGLRRRLGTRLSRA